MLVCRDGGLPGAEKIPQRLFVSSARRETFLLRHFSYTPEKNISLTPFQLRQRGNISVLHRVSSPDVFSPRFYRRSVSTLPPQRSSVPASQRRSAGEGRRRVWGRSARWRTAKTRQISMPTTTCIDISRWSRKKTRQIMALRRLHGCMYGARAVHGCDA